MKLSNTSQFFWAKSDAEVKAFESVGWKIAPQRRTHHHFHAILMLWAKSGEPKLPQNKAVRA